MTDETCCGACGFPVHATKEMACYWCRKSADRIETLTAERDEAWKRAAHSEKMWGEAEIKLAKAVEALGLIVVDNTWGLEHETYMKCRATLAEIKGESHEALPDLR